MFDALTVSTVFRFINFSIIIGAAVYFFKKKMLPNVIKKMEDKHVDLQQLTKQNKQLLGQQKEMNNSIDGQEVLGKKLYDQITIWSRFFDTQLEQIQQEQAILVIKASQRLSQQQSYTMNEQLRIQVLSKALDSAKLNLIEQFALPQKGDAFTASVIEHMRKELS